ncbi:threonylcarbamoyl-AMP synthase [Kordiimonas sediminis]|uniref:Threonylcarbamoyl-AMP synthase n=1 Tax=Kordiimonas sediminis TaxID=1735581 RepID=A0A919AUE0_9PROT|nr:L-threonylcarbamoyladenylate synthase [Kordiimonas sediminis]GHF26609.1 threonylcarbamoyl-AMP synthase [Kordiimonas sediminis]
MAKTTKYLENSDNLSLIKNATDILDGGQLVVIPTETVYGLAADATNSEAVKLIYSVKGRPSHNPLICHVCSAAMASRYVETPPAALKLMDRFWPGPLTIVLPLRQNTGISSMVTAGLTTLAVRSPDNTITQDIIAALDKPIAAPSANPSGKLSPVTAQDVEETLGDKIPLIIDGGQTRVGIESTIVAVEDDHITLLRPGTITADEIAEATTLAVHDRQDTKISAPGQLESHYAPNAAVQINVKSPTGNSVHIGFGECADAVLNLSETADLAEAAHNLFSTLKTADQLAGHKTITVAPIPNEGIGIALNDRLRRAAAPRDA